MPHNLNLLPNNSFALSSFSEPITSEDIKTYRKDTLQFCKKHGINKIIVDIKGQEAFICHTEVFKFKAAITKTSDKMYIALLCELEVEEVIISDFSLKTTGLTIKLFERYQQAIQWLESI